MKHFLLWKLRERIKTARQKEVVFTEQKIIESLLKKNQEKGTEKNSAA